MFYHDPIAGSEWYAVKQLSNGMWAAVCTRPSKIYKLGTVNYFAFDLSEGVWAIGQVQADCRSLTGNTIIGEQRKNN